MAFEFVVQGPDNTEFSRATKTRIRKQAMKAVAFARRKTGTYGKHNIRQYPVDRVKSSTDTREQAKDEQAVKELDQCLFRAKMPDLLSASRMLLPRLQETIDEYGIGNFDISALTGAHVGAISSGILSTHVCHLSGLLFSRQWSLFSVIPLRFGHVKCLDDAVRLLIVKCHTLLEPSFRLPESLLLAQYGESLRSLQAAVKDPEHWHDPEVLGATETLALFELLHSPSVVMWNKHTGGAVRLMQTRGPDRFTTEFNYAMFMSLMGPICCENFLNNEPNFLEEEEWQAVFRRIPSSHDIFSDVPGIMVRTCANMARLPGLACRISAAVASDPQPSPAELGDLAASTSEVRESMRRRREEFSDIVKTITETPSPLRLNRMFEIFGVILVTSIATSRLLSSVVPSRREMLEAEAVAFATELKLLQTGCHKNLKMSAQLSEQLTMADACLSTAGLWRESLDSGRIIERWKFDAWCNAIPRKTSTGKQSWEPMASKAKVASGSEFHVQIRDARVPGEQSVQALNWGADYLRTYCCSPSAYTSCITVGK